MKQQKEVAMIEERLEKMQKTAAAGSESASANKIAAAPLTQEERRRCDAIVCRAVEDNAEVKQWYALLVPKQMELEEIEKDSKQGKSNPLYFRKQQEIAIAEKKLQEVKQKVAEPIRTEAEFAIRDKRDDGVFGPKREVELLVSSVRTWSG